MILGLILSKTGLLTEHGSKDMANILLYAVIPCVIIRSYITDFTMEKLYGLLMSAVLSVAAFAVDIRNCDNNPPQGYDKYKKGIRQSCDNITCYRTVSFYYGN